jgi:hypothetical protein
VCFDKVVKQDLNMPSCKTLPSQATPVQQCHILGSVVAS